MDTVLTNLAFAFTVAAGATIGHHLAKRLVHFIEDTLDPLERWVP